MYPFVETICLINGNFRNLRYHNRRLNHTRKMNFDAKHFIDLEDRILIPEEFKTGKVKVRVLYTDEIIDIQFSTYQNIEINTLKTVEINPDFDYQFKSTQRKYFADLLSQHQENDLLLVKDNFITDSTFTNLIFSDGNQWFTPQNCLLEGCMRQHLLDQGKIISTLIALEDLPQFKSFKRINAMMDFDEAPELPISAISV